MIFIRLKMDQQRRCQADRLHQVIFLHVHMESIQHDPHEGSSTRVHKATACCVVLQKSVSNRFNGSTANRTPLPCASPGRLMQSIDHALHALLSTCLLDRRRRPPREHQRRTIERPAHGCCAAFHRHIDTTPEVSPPPSRRDACVIRRQIPLHIHPCRELQEQPRTLGGSGGASAGCISPGSGTSISQKSIPAAFIRANNGKCASVKGRA